MSTILRALDKQKSEQLHTMPAFIEKDAGALKWKVALFAAFLVIISLLAVVIYLLAKPLNDAEKESVFSAPISELHRVNKDAPVITTKAQDKSIRKISFDVKPLPQLQASVQIDKLSPVVEEVTPINNEHSDVASKEAAQLVVSGDKAPAQIESINNEIDYGETSADLQQRFENALLMSGIEDKEIVEQVDKDTDGSDIHQMSREFQEKVPAISYDSHMYSSVAQDRWIRINGEDLKEGQFDSSGQIQVVEIQANRTIFRLGRQSFSLESLTDWPGF